MIQFVEINRQDYHSYEFGFYDTISDTIMCFNGSMTWDNEYEFIEDFESEKEKWTDFNLELKRFTNKISSKFKQ